MADDSRKVSDTARRAIEELLTLDRDLELAVAQRDELQRQLDALREQFDALQAEHERLRSTRTADAADSPSVR